MAFAIQDLIDGSLKTDPRILRFNARFYTFENE